MASIIGFSRERLFAIIDVESGGVKIACVAVPSSGPVEIIAQDHTAISLEDRNPDQQTAWIVSQIAEIGKRVFEKVHQRRPRAQFESAYCIMHVPFVRSAASSVSGNFEAETRITAPIIADLAKEALATQKTIDTSRLFEASVMRILLNGYPTTHPEGKMARTIVVDTIVTECDPAMKGKIEDAVHALLPHTDIAWRSAVRATQTALASVQAKISDYVFVGVSADASHVTTIREGMLDTQCTVKEGLRSILARAGGGRSADEVLGFMRMIEREACEGDVCDSVRSSLATIEPDLARAFGEAMATIATKARLPNTLVLATHPDIAQWFASFFSRIDFTQFTQTAMPFSVLTLDAPAFSKMVAHGESADVSVLVGASLVNIEARL